MDNECDREMEIEKKQKKRQRRRIAIKDDDEKFLTMKCDYHDDETRTQFQKKKTKQSPLTDEL